MSNAKQTFERGVVWFLLLVMLLVVLFFMSIEKGTLKSNFGMYGKNVSMIKIANASGKKGCGPAPREITVRQMKDTDFHWYSFSCGSREVAIYCGEYYVYEKEKLVWLRRRYDDAYRLMNTFCPKEMTDAATAVIKSGGQR